MACDPEEMTRPTRSGLGPSGGRGAGGAALALAPAPARPTTRSLPTGLDRAPAPAAGRAGPPLPRSFAAPPGRGRGRYLSHALALAAVATLALLGASAPAREADLAAGPGPSVQAPPDWLLPALAAPGLTPQATSTPAGARSAAPSPVARAATPTAVQLQATPIQLGAALPLWVGASHSVALWSAPDDGAAPLTSVPPDGRLRPLGPYADGRLQVYFPGDGDGRPAIQGWVDGRAVAPSDPPAWLATSDASADDGARDGSSAGAPRRVSDAPPPEVTAQHVAIIDEASGRVLHADLPASRVAQASTTKIATTIVALERAPDLAQRIPVTVSATEMVNRDGSSVMWLEPGEEVSLETLLYGMMLSSGNDAAEQVALALAGSREQYVDWMNQEAAALGLPDTHFANPSGMDAPGHYSSALDMAVLARYAMRNEEFRKLAAAPRYADDDHLLKNLNRLIGLYPGADGVKVGYTDQARRTLVASATRDDHRVYVSLMHSEDLVGDATALFDWVWQTFSW